MALQDPLVAFRASLEGPSVPPGLSPQLAALWHAGRGDWEAAHGLVQEDESDIDNAWIHAHLHRQEGDLGNAGYWYRRARKPVASGPIEAEWENLARSFLSR